MAILDRRQLVPRALAFANSRGISLNFRDLLGDGTDGVVWPTSHGSALKVFYRPENYSDELKCYLRFREHKVERVGKLYIPHLVDYDDQYLAIEMGIVKPPRILDFGKVHIDAPPPYWDEPRVRAKFESDGRWLFREHWPDVIVALDELRNLGIHYVDPKPKNIEFGDEADDPNWNDEPPLEYEAYDE